ncbi:unnamed protein product, partial [marine sediment metagenome]
LKNEHLPLYHITNPPYLYLGYIRKHKETQEYLKLFEGKNEGYQDLYQIAMINDLRNNIENLIYIIPSNFLFGASVSNKFRLDLLKYYNINKMFIFETKIFEYTGTNICIGFFKKKPIPKSEIIEFSGIKIRKKDKIVEKSYILKPEFNYRAGSGSERIPKEHIEMCSKILNIPIIVGGGVSNKDDARCLVEAGADVVVMGTFLENNLLRDNGTSLKGIIEEIKNAGKTQKKNYLIK